MSEDAQQDARVAQTTLSAHGAGADDELDRRDDAEISERCQAVTDDGTRCNNAVSRMTDGPFCGPHSERGSDE